MFPLQRTGHCALGWSCDSCSHPIPVGALPAHSQVCAAWELGLEGWQGPRVVLFG